jgi:ankyrin repeat protein
MSQPLSQEMIDEFVVAAHHDLPFVKEKLAERPDLINENATWIETPIQAAAHVGNREIAEYLLDQGAPLDICTAAMLGLADDVRALLDEDPGLYEAEGAHRIPVMFFPTINGYIPIAQMLLDAGSAINTDEGRQSPLHGAAIFGQTEMAQWLLDHDANPYAKDYEGATPLDRAEANGHEAVAALLRPFFPEEEQASM